MKPEIIRLEFACAWKQSESATPDRSTVVVSCSGGGIPRHVQIRKQDGSTTPPIYVEDFLSIAAEVRGRMSDLKVKP